MAKAIVQNMAKQAYDEDIESMLAELEGRSDEGDRQEFADGDSPGLAGSSQL